MKSQSFTANPVHIDASMYSLDVHSSEEESSIVMKCFMEEVTTHRMRHVCDLLATHVPSIFKCQCFNSNLLPFEKEVKKTEIGHLYEHILLEQVAAIKRAQGNPEERSYRGTTSWNWNEDDRGTFHIWINVGNKDAAILDQAIRSSNEILEKIINYHVYFLN